MYLKSIELCGFKSFADKTKIEFDRQLTAVVGPNGCGKSNVVDAIRWCLGEQSAYSLRSPQMQGIIFSGSQTRPPLGLSEVSLTFDNSSNILPMDFTEITVTRKIFRSGESEYFINKAQCRLKDIRDLFLDTGVGRSGYSIFEQGKVEFITMAKPEERRALFEEAAGVAKYKVRREETLRKFEKVHNDMNRVNDIMSVIKEQTSSLESAVRKARLFKKYQEELKTLQIADFVKKIDVLYGELKPISAKLEELNKKIIAGNTRTDTLDAQQADLKFELTRFENEKTEASVRMAAIDRDIAQSEERSEGAVKMAGEFVQMKEIQQKNIKEFEAKSADVQKQIEKIKSDIEKNTPSVNSVKEKHSAKKQECENIYAKISSLRNEIMRLNAAIMDIINKKSSVSNDISRIESEIAFSSASQNSFGNELKKASSEKDKKSAEIAALTEEINKLKASFETETSETRKLSSTNDDLVPSLNKAREKQQRLSAVLELQKKDPKSRGVYAVISRGFKGIHGTVSSVLNISALQENAVTNFLGEKLNYIVCSTAGDALEAIEYLRSNSLGFATFIVEELLPEPRKLKELFSLRSGKSLISLVKCEQRWEKLAGFLLNESYLSSGTIRSDSIIFGGDVSQAVISEVEMDMKQTSELESEIKSLEIKLSESMETLKSKAAKLEEIRIFLATKESDANGKNEGIKLLNDEIAIIENDIKRQQDESKQKTLSLAPLREELSKISSRETSLRNELQNNESKLSELRETEQKLNSELNAFSGDLSALEERIQAYNREMSVYVSNLKTSIDQKERAESGVNELLTKIENTKKSRETEKIRFEGLHKDKTQVEKVLKEKISSYNEAYEKHKKVEEQLTAARSELKILDDEHHELQMANRGKEIEKNSLEKQLSETGIEFLDAKESYLNIEIEEGQIERLKRKIESMGAVNLTAQDEYSSLESRYNFLLSQQQDLIKAEEDLRSAIYKINASIRETFQAVFEQVRTNFKALFRQLFDGGEADLILTDENNLLETGVEINVQPAGKKIENGIELSQGEKALTSIALLFAFFMVKPSPVCVLDEVEAPLDDANVTRFLNMLKTFMGSSQFLVITHNKRTMEAADVIYGVTMEEDGISKIISLKLQKPGLPVEKTDEVIASEA